MPRPKRTEPKTTKKHTLASEPESKQQKPAALTGPVLIQKVKELGSFSKEQKAKACGYITVNKNGLERVNMMQFMNALIQAEGIDLNTRQSASGRGGRTASYRTKVQGNGNLLIGPAYTKQLGLNPGDEFEISLGRKHIRLLLVGGKEKDVVAELT